jgi:hypothetical protein
VDRQEHEDGVYKLTMGRSQAGGLRRLRRSAPTSPTQRSAATIVPNATTPAHIFTLIVRKLEVVKVSERKRRPRRIAHGHQHGVLLGESQCIFMIKDESLARRINARHTEIIAHQSKRPH